MKRQHCLDSPWAGATFWFSDRKQLDTKTYRWPVKTSTEFIEARFVLSVQNILETDQSFFMYSNLEKSTNVFVCHFQGSHVQVTGDFRQNRPEI